MDDKWARKLANVRANARAVNKNTVSRKAASGDLYHHKHDLAPTPEQITTMCVVGLTGDSRVDHDVLDACEAGAAVAIYMPTGARGSELKQMFLQSIGYEALPCEKPGLIFECVKLVAYECKTKDWHLNQFLPASNPWNCGLGGFGMSVLLRVKRHGAPPFTMRKDASSWMILGSSAGSLDRRINDLFALAGVRRQSRDPLTYLGRHFGTRRLQHQGGSSEGGAARRGHTGGATFAYSECPLPDMLRLMGNDADAPFLPAHLQDGEVVDEAAGRRHTSDLADAVLVHLFPQLFEHRDALEKRQRVVDRMRGKSVKVRTAEHLNDQERLINGLLLACRTTLRCLVARPRTWKRWAILEEATTLWEMGAARVRTIAALFGDNAPAVAAMNTLARAVRHCEEAEITARKADPKEAASQAVVEAVKEIHEQMAAREDKMLSAVLAEQRRTADAITAALGTAAPSPLADPSSSTALAGPSSTALAGPSAPESQLAPAPLAGVRIKRKAEAQEDVAHFSSHSTVRAAFDYLCETLVPRERAHGANWRILKRTDGWDDKSRDRQWRFYRQLAIAVGMVQDQTGATVDEAVVALQERRDTLPSPTAFVKMMTTEQQDLRNADAIARRVMKL